MMKALLAFVIIETFAGLSFGEAGMPLPSAQYSFKIAPLHDNLKRAEFGQHCEFQSITPPERGPSHFVVYSDKLGEYLRSFQLPLITVTFEVNKVTKRLEPSVIGNKKVADLTIPGRVILYRIISE